MNTLILTLNQDKAGDQDAACVVRVNGKQVGGLLTVSAERGKGRDVFELRGDWPAGNHNFSVDFTNDYKDGEQDRNLYLVSASINGEPIKYAFPVRMTTNGPCEPIGFYFPEVPYSIPEQFGIIRQQVDDVRAEQSAGQHAVLDAIASLRAEVAALRDAKAPSPAPAPAASAAA